MPEEPNNQELNDGELDSGRKQEKESEGEAGQLGLIIALVYGTGLATSNIFLTQYGIRDFSLLKPRAIFAGAIVLGMIALISSGPMNLISRYIDHNGIGKLRDASTWGALAFKLLLPFVALFILTAAAIVRSEGLIAEGWHWKIIAPGLEEALLYSIGLFLTACATAALSIQSLRKFRNIQHARSFSGIANRLSMISLYVAGAIVSLSLYISLFTASLFESVPAAVGGLGSDTVQLQVRKEFVDDLQNLGVRFDTKNKLLTQPLPLVYESEDQLYVAVFRSAPEGAQEQGSITSLPGQSPMVAPIKVTSEVLKLDKKLITASLVSRAGD